MTAMISGQERLRWRRLCVRRIGENIFRVDDIRRHGYADDKVRQL